MPVSKFTINPTKEQKDEWARSWEEAKKLRASLPITNSITPKPKERKKKVKTKFVDPNQLKLF